MTLQGPSPFLEDDYPRAHENDNDMVVGWAKITRPISIPEYIEGTAKGTIRMIRGAPHELVECTFKEFRSNRKWYGIEEPQWGTKHSMKLPDGFLK